MSSPRRFGFKRADMWAAERAAQQARMAERQSKPAFAWETGHSLSSRVDSLIRAREHLGSGPKPGPRIKAAWHEAAIDFEAAREVLLAELRDYLRLPEED